MFTGEDPCPHATLVVEDEVKLAQYLHKGLGENGYVVDVAHDGIEGRRLATGGDYDLVLLDLMLPGINGVDVCRRIRGESGVPIVMLTAKSDTGDVVDGLQAGADDYVAKPFKPRELVARIWTRLRRPAAESDTETIRIGDVVVNVAAHQVRRAGQSIPLTPLEFDLLLALARRPNQVFSREKLLEQVWGYRHAADTRLVNVHVQRLRSKIENDPEKPEIVVTVRGIGYKAGDFAD